MQSGSNIILYCWNLWPRHIYSLVLAFVFLVYSIFGAASSRHFLTEREQLKFFFLFTQKIKCVQSVLYAADKN